MKKIRIRDKDYNCSNMLYYHIQALESENRLFNMEIKAHEQNELELKDRLSKAIEYIEKLEEDYVCYQESSTFYRYGNKHDYLDFEDVRKELLNILRGDKE